MTRQDQLKQCRLRLTNGMEEVGFGESDIWQDNLIYWMIKAILLLLNKEIKEQ